MGVKRSSGTTPGLGTEIVPIPSVLNDLDDVSLTSLSGNDILTYNAGAATQPLPIDGTASHTQAGYPISQTYDDNTGTEWRSGIGQVSAVITLDYDLGAAYNINKIVLLQNHGSDFSDAVQVYYSDTGTSWTLVDTFHLLVQGSNDLGFTPSSHRYWRIKEISSRSVWWRVQEIEFYSITPTWGNESRDTWLDALFRRPSDETVHADDQEFNGTLGGTAVTPTGTATWKQSRGLLSVLFDTIATSDFAVRLYPLTPTTSPVTIEAAFRVLASDGDYTMVGIAFTDGIVTTSNMAAVTLDVQSNTYKKRSGTITNAATVSAGDAWEESNFGLVYLRLVWSASNTFKSQISPDGVSWTNWADVASIAKTMTPTHFGVAVSNWGITVKQVASFEYLRVTESDLSV